MKVLMVCLGNICRSPLAQGILESQVARSGLNWEVDSCGTAAYHVGNAPDPRSIEVAKLNGIDISGQKARAIDLADFDRFDLILAMDSNNYKDIRSLAKNSDAYDKVRMIMNYVYPGKNVSVPDPYYGGDEGFVNVYRMLETACESLIEKHA